MNNKLHLGVGREIITPRLGTFLSGYSTSGRDATSVNDDLTATVFCFEQGSLRAALVSLTLTLLDKEIADQLRSRIEGVCGIPREHIIVHSTHTHSAPLTFTTKGWGTPNAEYVDNILIPRTVMAARTAMENLGEVSLSVSSANSFAGVNRRELGDNSEIILGQWDAGPFDPAMTVLSFADGEGKCVANLIHYGCHATAAGNNLEISRDWPGVMTDSLERVSGGTTAFINGTEGDVGPRLSNGKTTGKGDIRYAFEQGKIAAEDAVAIYGRAIYKDAELRCVEREIKIPVERRISLEEAKERLSGVNDPNPQHAERIRMFYEEIIRSYEEGYRERDFVSYRQTAIKIGDAAFVSSPFETFSEIGLRIKCHSDIPHVLCISMANGCESYLPTKKEIYRGGYETKCFKTEHIQPLIDDADSAFVEETLKTLNQLKL